MKELVFVFCFLMSAAGIGCMEDELSGLIPVTQKPICVRRWQNEQMTVISEEDCIFCRELLERMRKEMPAIEKKRVELLWIDSNPVSCLKSSQQFTEFGSARCVSRREVAEKWGVSSTPVMFWIQKDKKFTQKGLVDRKKKLPWISSPSRSVVK
jgi:thioredoxin-related protein